MSTRPNRLTEPGDLSRPVLVVLCVVAALAAVVMVVVGAFLLAPGRSGPSGFSQQQGTMFSWPILVAGLLAIAVVGALLIVAFRRSGQGASRIDEKAKYMAFPKDLADMTRTAQARNTSRLGIESCGDGVPIGEMVQGGAELLSSFESVRIAILGPRAGKTSALAIRELMETKGPALATSNKRDLVDATRGPRSELGVVRVHDVQNLVGEKSSWWWNPLSFVTSVENAERLAAIFAASNTPRDARADAYFSPAGRGYLSGLLLAAAVGDRPISQVLAWMSDPDDREPVLLLSGAGYELASQDLKGTIELTPKQRDGVIGTAAPWVAFLRNPAFTAWVEPSGPEDSRPQFDPHSFVRSTADTLYLISKEGEGSARAITAALTMATLDAADKLGAESKGMRLPRPLMACLDEAANVVRIPELPDLYSHYGSRGIILSIFLQSWTQGVEAWGEGGMKKMWSAANIRMVGAGIAEVPFVREVVDLVGPRDAHSGSVSTGRGGRSSSQSLRRENILEVADIAGFSTGRVLLFSSGNPATLVKLIPWWKREYAQSVTASKDYYEQVG